MPKSKRQRVKPLTQTDAKGKEIKSKLIDAIRHTVDKYASIYVFSFHNMRTTHFKKVRMDFPDSRFFMGKNKVMKIALGRTREEEYAEQLAKLGQDVTGHMGLLFTNKPQDEVVTYFKSLSITDFARSGFVATESWTVSSGPLTQFVGSQLESLRQLGLPLELRKGVLFLTEDHTICTKEDVLTPEQAKLLVHFNHPMANFEIKLESRWAEGQYESY